MPEAWRRLTERKDGAEALVACRRIGCSVSHGTAACTYQEEAEVYRRTLRLDVCNTEEFQLMKWYAADHCMLVAAFDELIILRSLVIAARDYVSLPVLLRIKQLMYFMSRSCARALLVQPCGYFLQAILLDTEELVYHHIFLAKPQEHIELPSINNIPSQYCLLYLHLSCSCVICVLILEPRYALYDCTTKSRSI